MRSLKSAIQSKSAHLEMHSSECVIHRIAGILEEEPRLKAVTISKRDHQLSIATLGREQNIDLSQRISAAVRDGEMDCKEMMRGGYCSECYKRAAMHTQLGRLLVRPTKDGILIEKPTCLTAITLWRWIKLDWPRYAPREMKPFDTKNEKEHEWRVLAALASGCLVFGLLGMATELLWKLQGVAVGMYVIAYLSGGWDAAKDALEKLRKFQLDIHFLMLAVALGAASIGAWREGALLLFLFSASGAMEEYAMGRTQGAISALFKEAPKTARVVNNGKEENVKIEEIISGMTVLVTAGEQFPVDMEVVKGETDVDESSLTGESRPVSKKPGDTVLSGTFNLWGAIQGRVLHSANESALQKIITLIKDAQNMKAPSQRFTDRFGTRYTWAILGICFLMFFVWWQIMDLPAFVSFGNIKSAFYRAMTLLVVASPCALVLSVPSSILSAIASGARHGILFRGGAAVETLADVSVVALDKTGTLTTGELMLETMDCFAGDTHKLQDIAATLARLSQHPLSRAIAKAAYKWDTKGLEIEMLKTIPGRGLQAMIDGKEYRLGSRSFLNELHWISEEIKTASSSAEVWIGGSDILGHLVFSDSIRPEARRTLDSLRKAGIKTVMLTGDHSGVAAHIGQETGVDDIRSGLLPEDKVQAVQELKESGLARVAMIGDGVNDAPCIAAADVGVAMGARGSDAALEQAEIVLMNDRLENFLLARSLSKRSRRIIFQNISVALGAVIGMVCIAFLVPIPLSLGVLVHEGSTVLVVLNSLRLLSVKKLKI